MTSKRAVTRVPTVAPNRTLKALIQQLAGLQKLKNRNYNEAESDETQWGALSRGIIEAAFGDPSPSMSRFHMASAAGEHNIMGVSDRQRQINFESRIREYDALLESLISMLRLQLPEEEINEIYEPGEQYDFYRDLSSLLAGATTEIFIVDAYLDEDIFNLYVDKVPAIAKVRVLSNRIQPNVEKIAKMYASHRSLELRSSADVHDRAVFVDDRGCVIGQSIKDAARKKPTYLVELSEPSLSANRDIHNRIWSVARVVV